MEAPKGSLVIGGAGLKSISQFTLETIMHIEKANQVFYCVSDPIAEGFIRSKNANAEDLYQYYSNSKERMATYIQMAEVMLKAVREGLQVVGIFYGHPGFFVGPAHRAIAIALDEGYSARMLPGISSMDCLFADLLIDPADHGCQIVEATEILVRGRTLQTSTNVILFQVGCIGVTGFHLTDMKNPHFQSLVDRLEKDYGLDHPVVDYRAATSPLEESSINRHTIADLRKPEVQEGISTASTFYLPPKIALPVVEGLEQLGLNPRMNCSPMMYPPHPFNASLFPASSPYGDMEMEAIASLRSDTGLEGYRPYSASIAMQKTMESLSTNIGAIEKYKASPKDFVAAITGLELSEEKALESGSADLVKSVMHGYQDEKFTTAIIKGTAAIIKGTTAIIKGTTAIIKDTTTPPH
ncbi:unnamed protein product [Clonostachys chloroleuca]|uniref:Tetrapyrrole methylase domain-containing protein n=1 Tax=Clonostachys chloroleuca TaxID=1926264 RepID=A0AA35QCK6_9HYPO|nr:unnamed protein product [Clonostachys chloroleuca]